MSLLILIANITGPGVIFLLLLNQFVILPTLKVCGSAYLCSSYLIYNPVHVEHIVAPL